MQKLTNVRSLLLVLLAFALVPSAEAQQDRWGAPQAHRSTFGHEAAALHVFGAPVLHANPSNGFSSEGTVHLFYGSTYDQPVRITVRADQAPQWETRVGAVPSSFHPLPESRQAGQLLPLKRLKTQPIPLITNVRKGGGVVAVRYTLTPKKLDAPGTQTLVVTYEIEAH